MCVRFIRVVPCGVVTQEPGAFLHQSQAGCAFSYEDSSMPALQASTSRSDRGLLVLCRLRLRHHPRRPSLRSRRVIRRQPATCGWSGIVGRPKAIMNRPRFHAVGRGLAEQPIFDAMGVAGAAPLKHKLLVQQQPSRRRSWKTGVTHAEHTWHRFCFCPRRVRRQCRYQL